MARSRQNMSMDQVLSKPQRTPALFEQPLEEDDPTNPAHYQGTACLDAIKLHLTHEEYRGFLRGTIMKYEWRLGEKPAEDPLTDLQKMLWYAEKLRDLLTYEGWTPAE